MCTCIGPKSMNILLAKESTPVLTYQLLVNARTHVTQSHDTNGNDFIICECLCIAFAGVNH